ncbi:hypothetical protein KC842_00685 [Candidatus Nomurabacteria bacterium]|nr:hypothetical protein [Candidatus Nomurabacteria bacterium]USN94914.1 MAG: hypothetical protein H6791_00600 [Candidatus Nomurabacteria bacterium]
MKFNHFIFGIIGLGVFTFVGYKAPDIKLDGLIAINQKSEAETSLIESDVEAKVEVEEEPKKVASHIETPDSMKAVYMTSWVAGTPSIRNSVISLVERTEVNSIIIDIKDYTGKVAFQIDDEVIQEIGSTENRIRDIESLIEELHSKNIYVIGRVAVFQDPHIVKVWPEEAVKKASDKNSVWKDRKGISWIDAGSERVWDYTYRIAKGSYDLGFDEINFDYIRFPSDGDMKDIYYPVSEGKVKSEVMNSFYTFIGDKLRADGIPSSADLFGMTTTNTDDLNIGQILEDGLRNFDYVCPMVYPSHYPDTWHGFPKPAEVPYDVVYIAMKSAVDRAIAIGKSAENLRPWIQDFNLGATYTADMVRAQITATYDAGIDSWLIWDPANTYTEKALEPSEAGN